MVFFKGVYVFSSLIKDSLLVGVMVGMFYLFYKCLVYI